jgi:hypothetical protein
MQQLINLASDSSQKTSVEFASAFDPRRIWLIMDLRHGNTAQVFLHRNGPEDRS